MRYSIMLQLVTTISAIFIAAAALFAWIQNRQTEPVQEVTKISSPRQSRLSR